jgi:Uma2 family endonuclease
MSTHPLLYFTPEQYLTFDRSSDRRHEYLYGEIFPVENGTPAHSLIGANALVAIAKRLSTDNCRAYNPNLRVCHDPKFSYFYPDVTVVCGKLEFTDDKQDTVTNPKVIVEVLSPSTLNYDLGAKARLYWKIASLTDLLFIDQKRVWIEYWIRTLAGKWERQVFESLNDIVSIGSTASEIPVAEIYAGVELNHLQP